MEWLNYHHLYYFWTVMREGSITKACVKLSLAQSTVSAHLSKLEESLGGKLFNRQGRAIEATDMGRLVSRYADEIFSLGRELMGLDTRLSGHERLVTAPNLADSYVATVLHHFRALYPAVVVYHDWKLAAPDLMVREIAGPLPLQ